MQEGTCIQLIIASKVFPSHRMVRSGEWIIIYQNQNIGFKRKKIRGEY